MDLHLDVKIASLCWAVVQSRVVVPPTADRWRRGGAGWPGTHLGLHRAGRPPPATPRHQNKTDHSHHQHLASVSADITSHQPHCPCYANHQTFISVAQVISWIMAWIMIKPVWNHVPSSLHVPCRAWLVDPVQTLCRFQWEYGQWLLAAML